VHTRVQIASIAFAVIMFVLVFELVRRRYVRERYALGWLGAALVLIVLAIWKRLLGTVATVLGIYYAPNAFFVIAFGVLLLVLLDFSMVVSRLTNQTRLLAQRLALLEERQRAEAQSEREREAERESLPPGAESASGTLTGRSR
jgi:hypothetical protein